MTISAKEIANMENSRIRPYSALIALLVVMNAAMAWGRPNNAATADAASHVEMITAINDMSTECSTFMSAEYLYENDVRDQRPSTNGVMVAEDMRCRQCRGKCKAEDLRCRSQCVGEGICLAHCEERLSKCETMCKQVFRCE